VEKVHIARTDIAVRTMHGMSIGRIPSQSANSPGNILAGIVKALIIVTRYADISEGTLCEKPYVLMKKNGIKSTRKTRKDPIVARVYFISLNPRKSMAFLKVVSPDGGNQVLIVRQEIRRHGNVVRAMALTAHAKPIFAIRRCNTIGYRIPPNEDDAPAIDMA
jgi:hypothetical protein